MDDHGQGQPRDLLGSLTALLLLLILGWMAWQMVVRPSWPRLRISLLRSSHRVMSGLARRTGALSMGAELSSGVQDYRLPYWLSVRRDGLARQAARAEDEMRP